MNVIKLVILKIYFCSFLTLTNVKTKHDLLSTYLHAETSKNFLRSKTNT